MSSDRLKSKLKFKETNNDITMSVEEWKKTKNQKVLHKIISNHYSMIHSIVNNISVDSIAKEDLFSEGVIGVMTALDKFEIDKNAKFSTYAYFWIRSKIYKFLKKINPLQDKQKKSELAENEFPLFDNDEALLNKVMKSRKVQQLEDNDMAWSRFSNPKETETIFEDKNIVSLIRILFLNLSKKEQTIIEKRYLSDRKYTFSEISEIIGLSSERVRQLEKDVFKKFKNIIMSQFGDIRGELLLIKALKDLAEFKFVWSEIESAK